MMTLAERLRSKVCKSADGGVYPISLLVGQLPTKATIGNGLEIDDCATLGLRHAPNPAGVCSSGEYWTMGASLIQQCRVGEEGLSDCKATFGTGTMMTVHL